MCMHMGLIRMDFIKLIMTCLQYLNLRNFSHVSAGFEEERGFLENAVLTLQDHLVKEWFTFGLHLGLEVKELNLLESSYLCHPDQRICVRQMLTKWKNKFNRKATWGRIVYALKKIENNSLAEEVVERFMQSASDTD